MIKMLKNRFINILGQNKYNYKNLINQINTLEDNLKILTDSELKSETLKIKQEYQTKQDSSTIIKAFALTREASLRTLGLRHFNVQLMSGLILNDRKIAEMKTGEGKTLAATLPAFFNTLTNKGVHIVTVNEYLAIRDQISMGQIFRFLGLRTGLITNKMEPAEKKSNYNADITYVTNSELVFDYLKDNMITQKTNNVLRSFNYCIIDEVDSILIDEAQTPLIISTTTKALSENYYLAFEVASYLKYNIDYKVNKKNKTVRLTEKGIKRSELLFNTENLYDPKKPWIQYLINAIKASIFYLNNINYIIQNNKIALVDEFTGRVLPDRQWSSGLHQAVEAKEKLSIAGKSKTISKISYQNFFLLYNKLSGMTGTGKTAEIEFQKIYQLPVKKIPTASLSQRKDLEDLVYKDQLSKWTAITEECSKLSLTGQPILIGTTTIEKSEMVAKLLNEYNLEYRVLNAKPENIRKESEIVAQAGQKHSITIATNMAGRGTDIILGGNANIKAQKKLYDLLTRFKNDKSLQKSKNSINFFYFFESSQKFLSTFISILTNKMFLKLSDLEILQILRGNNENKNISNRIISYQSSVQFLFNLLIQYYKKNQKQDNKIIKNLGGLYIIGTERNDSKRVDNQLRGRCGRQGDPGISRFFLSLDDRLLSLFGSKKVNSTIKNIIPDDAPIESVILTKALDSAQKTVEERAFEARKNLCDYEKILNKQRQLTYKDRKICLESNRIGKFFIAFKEQIKTEFNYKTGYKYNNYIIKKKLDNLEYKSIELISRKKINNFIELNNKSQGFAESWLVACQDLIRFSLFNKKIKINADQIILLLIIDKVWIKHLTKIALLREGVNWRGYGRQNPLSEYQLEANRIYRDTLQIYRYAIISEKNKVKYLY
uniref:Protein translocase subunit SecA n=1 Tax=Climaconeis cf. scalaris TaxID=2846828 RepID=A0A8F8SRF5_9STRA|nr:subunit A of preprotein-translocase [Climaconeis cf. scalaris]QYB19386.1 subunit A of preprotein-translocase [Climaconeis cf. scalaris]